jgi:hypothetical protein
MEPPPMDAVDDVLRLQNIVPGWIEHNQGPKDEITNIACLLLASFFYFEHNGNPVVAQGTFVTLLS